MIILSYDSTSNHFLLDVEASVPVDAVFFLLRITPNGIPMLARSATPMAIINTIHKMCIVTINLKYKGQRFWHHHII